MRIGDFSASIAKLHSAIDALEYSWIEAQQHWDDGTSRRLGEAQVRPIVQNVREVIEAAVPLGDVMAQIRRDCQP
jgi:hypothetical protein